MDVERAFRFSTTKQALTTLQRLLFCCQCGQLTKNVCTLGNCEHLYCKQCVEERLGASCSVCEMPAHAKDALVNKQLSNIASVSFELDKLLQRHLDGGSLDEGYQGPSVKATLSPQSDCQTSASIDNNNKTNCLDYDIDTAQFETASSLDTKSIRDCPETLSKKMADEKVKPIKTSADNQLCFEKLDRKSDQEQRKTVPARKGSSTPSPQTRLRKKRSSTMNLVDGEPSTPNDTLDQSLENLTPVNGEQENKRNYSTEDDNSSLSSLSPCQPAVTTPRQKGRQRNKLGGLTRADRKQMPKADENSTVQSPPQRKRCTAKKTVSATLNKTKVNDTPVPCPRRRSTPRKDLLQVKGVSLRIDRSASASPSPKSSPVSSVSPAGRSVGKRKSDGNMTRLKRNVKGETPLHVLSIKGDVSGVKQLLTEGNNPNVRDNAGWTPLHEAVNHGHTAVAEVLLQHGAMVNTPGMDNDTPLHDAVLNNRVDCVRVLVMYGASTAARNIHGRTVLELAKTDHMRAALQQPMLKQPLVTKQPEMEDADQFLPVCFLGTGLNRTQQGLLQKCAAKLHAKVVDEYSCEVTHVVSSVNPDGQCPRTLKYMRAVLGGKWIVSIEWISVCLEYGHKVAEEAFEVPGTSTHPNSNAAKKARLNHKLQLPGLFDGCQVFLHGSFTRLPPSKQDLTELLRLGGAHLLTREPRLSNLDEYDVTVPYHAAAGSSIADCGIFIVHDGGTKAPTLKAQRMRAVPASWIIECIATFSLPEPDSV